MTMQKLLSKARKAIQDFNMIQENDKIAVGLSGGKDSLTLLHILKNYQRFSPQKFELIAITLNPGGVDNSPLYKLCKDLDIEFHEVQTDIKEIVFDIRKESIEENEPGYLATKIGKLIGFFNLVFGELDEEEKGILEEKIIEVYRLKGITFNDNTLYKNKKFKIIFFI